MSVTEPIKRALSATAHVWDHEAVRPAVRANFQKVLRCKTRALGAEVYASATEQKLVHHTCKSRACPSCGHWATRQWQRAQWAALPEMPYHGIVFTMPDKLWPVFQQNRHLLHDLPALGAEVIQNWAKQQAGAQVLLTVVPHTFGRHLNFNCHLHILVSAGGLRESDGSWVRSIKYDIKLLVARWRYAVVKYLRAALRSGVLKSSLPESALLRLFTEQYERKWMGHVSRFSSKEHFLRYAGRYVRRPPIAQYRVVSLDDLTIRFRTKDLRLKREVIDQRHISDFVLALAEHVPDRYRHAMRHFGLSAPRAKAMLSAGMFRLLGQQMRPKPSRLRWAHSIQRDFGVNPLLDSTGQMMKWVGRKAPTAV